MFDARRRRIRTMGVAMALVLAACSGSDSESVDTTPATAPSTEADATTADSSDFIAEDSTAPVETSAPATEPETTEPATTESATTEPPVTESVSTEPPTTEPEPPTTEAAPTTEASPAAGELTADRPYDVFVPSTYDAAAPMPLMLLLHGYTATGDIQEAYFRFERLAESRGFLYVHPDGTVDDRGEPFWNATDACCGRTDNPPDDAAYLMAIIDEVSTDYNVDPNAIFLAGHSNGGFMSYRMACQHADTIAGVASLAGATFADTADCNPSEPVSVLQVHGTDDDTILYHGGLIGSTGYPSARQTVETWAASNACDDTTSVTVDALDLDGSIDGSESDVEVFDGCEQGTQVALWTIDGGSHIPGVTDDFGAGVVDFLLAHPKP